MFARSFWTAQTVWRAGPFEPRKQCGAPMTHWGADGGGGMRTPKMFEIKKKNVAFFSTLVFFFLNLAQKIRMFSNQIKKKFDGCSQTKYCWAGLTAENEGTATEGPKTKCNDLI